MAATLTTFAAAVGTGNEDTEIEISFNSLITQGNETSTGAIDRFKVTSVTSGTLRIGTDSTNATAYASGSNDIIDATHFAYWTPDANANGTLAPFYVIAGNGAADWSGTAGSGDVQVTVDVTPVVDPLTITSSTVSGNEEGLIAVTLSAIDDSFDVVKFTININSVTHGTLYSDNTGTVPIDVSNNDITATGGNATVYFKPSQDYNGSATFDYTATNNDTPQAATTPATTMTITVAAVNDAPTGTNDSNITILEDGSFTIFPPAFGFSDVEDNLLTGGANHLTAVKITTLPVNGTLTNNGVAITAQNIIDNAAIATISFADLSSSKLVFTPAANANGNSYATIGFKVEDANSTFSDAANTLTFNVTPVNDGLTVVADSSTDVQTVAESELSIAVTDGTAGDAVGATEVVTVTFPALTNGQSFTLGGLTVTATGVVSANDVAAAFASLADGATSINTTTNLTATAGALTNFTTDTASTNTVKFTGAQVGSFELNQSISGLVGGLTNSSFGFDYGTVDVTFPALATGDSFTLAGLTVTATGAVTAANLALAFESLTEGATDINTTSYTGGNLTASGVLTGFDTSAASTATVTFTDKGGITPLEKTINVVHAATTLSAADFTFDASTSVTNHRGVDSTIGQTERAEVTFVDLANGDVFTLGGLTVTATATVLAADVAAAFSNLSDNATDINTTAYTGGNLTASNALTGFNTFNVVSGTHVIFESTTPEANVANLVSIDSSTPANPSLNSTITSTGSFTASDTTDNEAIDAHIVSVAIAGTGDGATIASTFSNLQALNLLSFNASSYQNSIQTTTDGTSGTTNWYFNSDGFVANSQLSDAFGQLKASDSLTFTYDVQFVDASNAIETRTVAITVTGTGDAPIVTIPLPDINVVKDEALSYSLAESFADSDLNDTLTYTFTVNGGAAPAWLTLSGGNTISKLNTDVAPVGDYVIEVTATDTSGASVSDKFVLEVTNEAVHDATLGALRPIFVSSKDAAGLPVADTFSGTDSVKEAVSYSQAAVGVNVTLPAANTQSTIAGGMGADAVGDVFLNIDNLIGSDYNDTLTGNADDNIIYGGAGTDTIDGAGGSDILYGGAGSDNITAGAGTDTIYGEADDDIIILGANLTLDDSIDGGTGYDELRFTDAGGATTDINSVTNVELISLGNAATAITSVNANVATGATLTVDASALLAANGLTWDGHLETDGYFSITGGAGSDSITGGSLADTIVGSNGSDSISGHSGDDSISTGTGDDSITGDDGNDIISAGAGSNTVDGGLGDDRITAAAATDSINGGEGADVILMGTYLTAADAIDGGVDSSSDVSIDTLAFTDAGGATDDIANVTNIETIILGNATTDVVAVNFNVAGGKILTVDATAILAANTLTWDAHNEGDGSYSIVGGNGSDTITGGGQNDTISGGIGSDAINGGLGTDSINAGAGDDVITLTTLSANESIDGGAGNDTLIVNAATALTNLAAGFDDLVTEASIENLVINEAGTATITLDEAINGSTLNISGIASSSPAYTLALGTLTATNVSLANLTFASRAYGNGVNDAGVSIAGGSSVALTAGNTATKFTVQLAATASTFVGSSINDVVTGGAQNDNIDGGAGSDTISGGTGSDTIYGGAGDDSLDGGTGVDTLYGGHGNDVFVVDETTDKVIELSTNTSSTADLVKSSAGTFTLPLYVERLTLLGDATNDINGIGNNLNNIITGNAGDNSIDGGTGNDTMIGGGGSDTYIVDSISDSVTGGAGNDTVKASVTYTITNTAVENLELTGRTVINGTGNSSSNSIKGNIAANLLNGAGGNDTILGMDGNDTLSGGLGTDTLTGGNGVDRFKFESSYVTDAKVDTITDFSRSLLEKIDLLSIDANTGAANDQAFTFIGTSAFGSVAGQLRYTSGTNSTVEGDVDGNGTADFSITVNGVATLAATDFIL